MIIPHAHGRRRRFLPLTISLIIVLGGGAALRALWRNREAHQYAATPATGAAPAVYTVRGRIEQLPDPAVKGSTLQIHHEKIPAFIDRDGKATGMNEMLMPFPPAPGLSLDGLAVGDNVEFTFEVRWDRIPFQQATRIAKLPPGVDPAISGKQ